MIDLVLEGEFLDHGGTTLAKETPRTPATKIQTGPKSILKQ